jgi:competence protein ComEA
MDINTADAAGLESVDGIGPALAQRIVEYRTQNGRFRICTVLLKVSGIGEKTLEKTNPT